MVATTPVQGQSRRGGGWHGGGSGWNGGGAGWRHGGHYWHGRDRFGISVGLGLGAFGFYPYYGYGELWPGYWYGYAGYPAYRYNYTYQPPTVVATAPVSYASDPPDPPSQTTPTIATSPASSSPMSSANRLFGR